VNNQRVKKESTERLKTAGKCNQGYMPKPPFKVYRERVGLYTKLRRILNEGNLVPSLLIWDH
jgi:hypothetical protein